MENKESEEENQSDPLISALDKLGEGSKFLWLIFIFAWICSMLGGLHSMSYVFITEIPPYSCSIPELTAANWTNEQIKEISSIDTCTKYDYNYTYFSLLGYENTTKYIEILPKKPNFVSCSTFTYQEIGKTTIVSEWDLVCNRAAYRANTFMAISLGKMLGAGLFGIYADKNGRKKAVVIGIILISLAGPISAIIPWFWVFMISRFFIGLGMATVGYSSVILLTENAGCRYRQWMGIVFNSGYAVGTVLLAALSYGFPQWRHLLMAISFGSFLLIIYAWFIPESPRWLISQNRCSEAKKIIEKYYGPIPNSSLPMINPSNQENNLENNEKKNGFIKENFQSLRLMYVDPEMRKRSLIVNISWFTLSLCYYVIALNADNFTANRYLYVVIMGLTEIIGYIIPSFALIFLGRRTASALLYIIGATCLLCVLGIPRDYTGIVIGVALTGRFILSGVYGIIILYTSELFPTVMRNTAFGTSSFSSHIGSISAPYIADLLGSIVWWGPSTLCSILALIGGFLCLILPETREVHLTDTVAQETAAEREKSSLKKFYNCCSQISTLNK